MPGIVQISCLGTLGRFGNQLFQYAAAKGYARKIGATLEIPPWYLANRLFKNIKDPAVTSPIARLPIEQIPEDGQSNVNLYGYFQHSRAYKLYTLSDLRHWFEFQDWVHELFNNTPRALTAAHVRRGDYVTTFKHSFCTIDETAYLSAFEEYGCPSPVTWVREDKPSKSGVPGIDWLKDFYTLMTSKVLVRANSTFSVWAAILGNHPAVYSPVIDGLRGHCKNVKFIPGNHPKTADHPGVCDYLIKP